MTPSVSFSTRLVCLLVILTTAAGCSGELSESTNRREGRDDSEETVAKAASGKNSADKLPADVLADDTTDEELDVQYKDEEFEQTDDGEAVSPKKKKVQDTTPAKPSCESTGTWEAESSFTAVEPVAYFGSAKMASKISVKQTDAEISHEISSNITDHLKYGLSFWRSIYDTTSSFELVSKTELEKIKTEKALALPKCQLSFAKKLTVKSVSPQVMTEYSFNPPIPVPTLFSGKIDGNADNAQTVDFDSKLSVTEHNLDANGNISSSKIKETCDLKLTVDADEGGLKVSHASSGRLCFGAIYVMSRVFKLTHIENGNLKEFGLSRHDTAIFELK